MRHLELSEIAKMLAESSPVLDACRHLAELCPVCGERLKQVEALMQRIGHWDPEVAVREGLAADDLLEALLKKGQSLESWTALMEKKAKYQTWGVAWVALERAQTLMTEEASRREARDLARLAVAIAGTLSSSYHPESIADLKALAQATALASMPPGEESAGALRQIAAAVTALDEGTGDEAIARKVLDLLSQALQILSGGSGAPKPPER